MEALEAVGHRLLHAMSEALGQPADRFDATVDPPEVLLKVIRYRTPPGDEVNAASVSERQGVGAHRDTGFLSFVYQHEVGGLQVERGAEFVDVPVRPDAFVVNIGEMFQLVTRGYFRATVHRVVSPPAGIDRVSLAYFFNPKLEATLAPIELPRRSRRRGPGRRERRPGQPDPRQLRRQLAEGAPALPPRRRRAPPRRPARQRRLDDEQLTLSRPGVRVGARPPKRSRPRTNPDLFGRDSAQ